MENIHLQQKFIVDWVISLLIWDITERHRKCMKKAFG